MGFSCVFIGAALSIRRKSHALSWCRLMQMAGLSLERFRQTVDLYGPIVHLHRIADQSCHRERTWNLQPISYPMPSGYTARGSGFRLTHPRPDGYGLACNGL